MTLKIGLDLGSTAIKAVFVEDERIAWRGRTSTAPGQEHVARKLIDTGLTELGYAWEEVNGIASTGYGKKLFTSAQKNMDEITANAVGLFKLSGGHGKTVINIGGQDVKILSLSDAGQVDDFKMNDKCAAGTGRFYEVAARILDTPLEQFGELSRRSKAALEINSTCVVFAESEIVSLLAQGVNKEDIIKALNDSVARRVSSLMGRMSVSDSIYLDGGPALNQGLVESLEDELMTEVNVLAEPQFTVAYGAALSLE